MARDRIHIYDIDWILLLLVAAAVALGCVYLASASTAHFYTQLRWLGIGFAGMVVTVVIGYERLVSYAYLLYVSILALLVLVLFLPDRRGAHSWIDFPGFSVQPSEFAKIAIVLVLARYLMYRENQSTLPGLIPPVALVLLPMALILKQPDLGTGVILLPVLFVILFVSGARKRHLFGSIALGLSAALPMWMYILKDYQKKRIMAFWDPESYELSTAYQNIWSKISIGSGGMHGAGWGKGICNNLGLLPDRHTDFIFVVIAEEGGLFVAGALLLFFFLIVYCGLRAAGDTQEPAGRIVASGASALIGAQALLNLGVVVGLLPTTGITLPLISYGGSSMLSTFVLLGLIISVGAARPTVLHRETFTGGR